MSGKSPFEKPQRNKDVYSDYLKMKSGECSPEGNPITIVYLVKKYEITPARIYTIVKREKAKLDSGNSSVNIK